MTLNPGTSHVELNITKLILMFPIVIFSFIIKDHIDINFWNKVRGWQNKGWHIALHGYDHIYISSNSGLVPFNNKSEFAGAVFSPNGKILFVNIINLL